MTKKIILIASIAIMALFGFTGIASAANITFSAATPVDISDLIISSGSKVDGLVVGASTVTLTMAPDSNITFTSAAGNVMALDHASTGANSCVAGGGSSLTAAYDGVNPTVVLSLAGTVCSTYTLSEVNVAASPLTANTASAYTITFNTANALASGDKIRLDFGTGFTIADSTATSKVTTLTDDGTALTVSALLADSATKRVTITFGAAVDANSIINIVLSGTEFVTNPATASADTAVSGIDIYTTDTSESNAIIDASLNQTAFNRVISLVKGWNVFAPSQQLENSAIATALAPISGSYSAIYTLAWSSAASTMTWQTPTAIDPLYGYAIYMTAAASLPLDFAKETPTNATFSRNLDHKGWQLIGYTGTSASLDAQVNCLGGLTTSGNENFNSIVDLTGTASGSAATSHDIDGIGITPTTELRTGSGLLFTRDYGYAIDTTLDSLVLTGTRDR